MRKIISTVLTVCAIVIMLSGCGSKNNAVGKWYLSKGECLNIRSDGSWKIEGSDEYGTWKAFEDGVIEITGPDATMEGTLGKDELGKYIDFGDFKLYKDAYPSEEKIAEVRAKNAISLNPFDGVKYEISGISPYCKISINDQGCSEEVQKYVTYKLDKDFYANGETAVITAELSSHTGEKSYILASESSEYPISGQTEYVSSVEQIDMDTLKKEISDKINAMISASIGTDRLFGEDVIYNCIKKTDEWKAYEDQVYTVGNLNIKSVTENMNSAYLSLLKKQKENQFNSELPYNTVSFLYCFDFSVDYNVELREGGPSVLHIPGKMYVNIVAENIVKRQDGSMYWNDERCDFNVFISFDGIDNLTSNTVMSYSDNYNITQIEVQ